LRHVLSLTFLTAIDSILFSIAGFGHHLANRLADHGFTVFAGVLNINSEGPDKLKSRQLDNLHVVQLDLIKEDEIKTAVSKVKTILGSEGTVIYIFFLFFFFFFAKLMKKEYAKHNYRGKSL
jgi:hypothetical protein